MDMIITTASPKGGVAKTTTAIHIAAWMQVNKGDTLLVDADDNRSASHWAERARSNAGLPFQVIALNQLARYAHKYQNIVIDSGAGTNEDELKELVDGCDLLIIPTTPGGFSITATIQTVDILDKIGSQNFRILLTKIPSAPRTDGKDARDYLCQDLQYPLFEGWVREFAAFEKAANAGTIVNQVKRDPKAKIGWRDYCKVAEEIFDE